MPGQVFGEGGQHDAGAPDEHAAVPQIAAHGQISVRDIPVRLLAERPDPAVDHPAVIEQRPSRFQIPIGGGRMIGEHADRIEHRVTGRRRARGRDHPHELLDRLYEMVGGQNDHDRVTETLPHEQCGQADGRGRVAPRRFGHDVPRLQLGQLFAHESREIVVREHQDTIRAGEKTRARVALLQEALLTQ